MNPVNDTSWVILAGGQSSRMNGNDKGLIELNGKTLLKHSYDILAKQTDNIVINANRNQDLYRKIAPVIQDEIKGFQGPLAGIHACLTASHTQWVGFVPCDCPHIASDLVQRFCEAANEEKSVYVAHDGAHMQPIFSFWNVSALDALSDFLARGERKVGLFYKEVEAEHVDFSDNPDSFINLNTPEELNEFKQAKR